MELRHLRYFLTVAEELSFTRAAKRLFISQPPLSRQIGELEREVGAPLFIRDNKKVALTEAGKYFEQEVRQLLQALDKATVTTRKLADHMSGEFRIGYISSTFSSHISALVEYFTKAYPYVKCKLYEVPTASQVAALEQGKLDLGILRAPLQSPHLQAKVWFRDKYALVYNKQKLRLKTEKDLATLKDQTFIFFNKEYAPHYYQALLEICAGYGFTPHVMHESNNIGSILQLVRNGLGVSMVPSSLARVHAYPELAYWEIKRASLFTEVLLATPRENQSPLAKKAINFLCAERN